MPAKVSNAVTGGPRTGLHNSREPLKWFGPHETGSLTPAQVEAKLTAFADPEMWASSTFNHYLCAITLAFRLALQAGAVNSNPARLVLRSAEKNVRQVSCQISITLPLVSCAVRNCGFVRCWR